jgi:hypothetical protein
MWAIANKTLSYQDSSNLANGGSVGADSIAGKDNTLWTKVNDLSLNKDGYNVVLYILMVMVSMSWLVIAQPTC